MDLTLRAELNGVEVGASKYRLPGTSLVGSTEASLSDFATDLLRYVVSHDQQASEKERETYLNKSFLFRTRQAYESYYKDLTRQITKLLVSNIDLRSELKMLRYRIASRRRALFNEYSYRQELKRLKSLIKKYVKEYGKVSTQKEFPPSKESIYRIYALFRNPRFRDGIYKQVVGVSYGEYPDMAIKRFRRYRRVPENVELYAAYVRNKN